jgi:hypothetical protein
VLSSKTIGEMFTMMPMDLVTDIIEKSSMFRKEEVLAQMPLLKEKMLEIKYKRERPPFLARIFDILPTAKPELESKLYSTLIQHCSWEDVRDAAIRTLPSDLIWNLPNSIFKAVVSAMPLETQVQFFASQEDSMRAANFERFASKGAKNREMIEIEVNALAKNEIAIRKIQVDKKASIDAEFLIMAREYIGSVPEAQSEMKTEVEIWLKKIKGQAPVASKKPNYNNAA